MDKIITALGSLMVFGSIGSFDLGIMTAGTALLVSAFGIALALGGLWIGAKAQEEEQRDRIERGWKR